MSMKAVSASADFQEVINMLMDMDYCKPNEQNLDANGIGSPLNTPPVQGFGAGKERQ